MPAATIKLTLEYDNKSHVLSDSLVMDVMKTSRVRATERTSLLLRAVDGYAVLVPVPEVNRRRFIVAIQLDDHQMSLGGFGPPRGVYEADKHPDMITKLISERFALYPGQSITSM